MKRNRNHGSCLSRTMVRGHLERRFQSGSNLGSGLSRTLVRVCCKLRIQTGHNTLWGVYCCSLMQLLGSLGNVRLIRRWFFYSISKGGSLMKQYITLFLGCCAILILSSCTTKTPPDKVVCGGLAGQACPADQYCHYPEGADCGRADRVQLKVRFSPFRNWLCRFADTVPILVPVSIRTINSQRKHDPGVLRRPPCTSDFQTFLDNVPMRTLYFA